MSMTLTPSRGPMVLFAPDARLYAILSGHVTAGHWEDQGQPAYGRMRRLQIQRRPERRDPYSVKLQLIGRGDASAKQQAPGVVAPGVRRNDMREIPRLLRRLQNRDVVCHRRPTHVENARELWVLDLHTLARLTQQLHRGHHMHGDSGGADWMAFCFQPT